MSQNKKLLLGSETDFDEDPFSEGKEHYYKNRKCKIIRNSGHIYFVVVEFEDGVVDSILKFDLRKEPSTPLRTKLVIIGEALLYLITLGLYRPKYT